MSHSEGVVSKRGVSDFSPIRAHTSHRIPDVLRDADTLCAKSTDTAVRAEIVSSIFRTKRKMAGMKGKLTITGNDWLRFALLKRPVSFRFLTSNAFPLPCAVHKGKDLKDTNLLCMCRFGVLLPPSPTHRFQICSD